VGWDGWGGVGWNRMVGWHGMDVEGVINCALVGRGSPMHCIKHGGWRFGGELVGSLSGQLYVDRSRVPNRDWGRGEGWN